MAKWGQGDPRWIVEERADATNVNNWHWTEKNATNWSKDRLKQLLIGLKFDGAAGAAEITEVSTLEGEASASNRKGKLIFFYEWDIKCNWKGVINSEDMDTVKGSLSIPNLSDENNADEIDVEVSYEGSKPGSQNLKDMIRTNGAEVIRNAIAEYIAQLKQEFSQGMILPTDKKDAPPVTCATAGMVKDFKHTTITASPENSKRSDTTPNVVKAVKISTRKISMKEDFMCSVEELYRALTDKEMVQAFTRAPPGVWELEKGGRFSLFSGMITGEFQELDPNNKIVKRWRFKTWPEGHYSTVTMKFSQGSNCTTLTVSQTGVPESEAEKTKEGWTNYYWNSLRQTFGYAVNIF